MKKLYVGLMWSTMFLIILDLLCYCLNWLVLSWIVSILLIISAIGMAVVYMVFAKHKCTKCGTVFKGNRWEMFFAAHTPTKRKMTCPSCKEKVWCDDYFESKKNNEIEDIEKEKLDK